MCIRDSLLIINDCHITSHCQVTDKYVYIPYTTHSLPTDLVITNTTLLMYNTHGMRDIEDTGREHLHFSTGSTDCYDSVGTVKTGFS